MKNQGVFKLAIFGVLAGMVLSMIVGCGGGGGSNSNGNGNGGVTALSIMKKIPASATSFDFVDYGSFRADDDLRNVYSQPMLNTMMTSRSWEYALLTWTI